jgi:hypothetical protein
MRAESRDHSNTVPVEKQALFFMYVDESGDYGIERSPTSKVVLTGLVVHESQWRNCLTRIVKYRQASMSAFGLPVRKEVHAAEFLFKPGPDASIAKHDRLKIIRDFADLLASMADLVAINVVVSKVSKRTSQEVFEIAWTTLIQRFENTLRRCNFPGSHAAGSAGAYGMIFPDNTDNKRLRALMRKMRHYNPVPHMIGVGVGARDMPLLHVVEDPNFRTSGDSFFVQAADLIAFLLYQQECPSSYMKKKSGHNYFKRLEPILCKVASSTDRLGIVRR